MNVEEKQAKTEPWDPPTLICLGEGKKQQVKWGENQKQGVLEAK